MSCQLAGAAVVERERPSVAQELLAVPVAGKSVCFVLGIQWAEAVDAVTVEDNQDTVVGDHLQTLSTEAEGHYSQWVALEGLHHRY